MLIRYSLADEGIRPSMFCSKDLKNMYRIWKCRIVPTFLIFQQFSAWHPRSWWWDECVIRNISGLISLISVTSCPNSSFWEMIRSQRSWKIQNIRQHSNHIYYITLTTCTIYTWIHRLFRSAMETRVTLLLLTSSVAPASRPSSPAPAAHCGSGDTTLST